MVAGEVARAVVGLQRLYESRARNTQIPSRTWAPLFDSNQVKKPTDLDIRTHRQVSASIDEAGAGEALVRLADPSYQQRFACYARDS